jgi:hypothetical protein
MTVVIGGNERTIEGCYGHLSQPQSNLVTVGAQKRKNQREEVVVTVTVTDDRELKNAVK